MNLIKIFGWALLGIGVLIIGWTLISSYGIFTGKAVGPEIFKIEAKETPPITQGKTPTAPEEIQKEVEKMIGEQLKGILPVDALPKLLNLVVWSVLAFILIFGGSQLSILGIKLIKKA